MTRPLGSKKRRLVEKVERVSCVLNSGLLSKRGFREKTEERKLRFYSVSILKSQRRIDDDEAGGQQKDQSKDMEVEFFKVCLPSSLLATAMNSKSEKTSFEITSLKPAFPPLTFRNLTQFLS